MLLNGAPKKNRGGMSEEHPAPFAAPKLGNRGRRQEGDLPSPTKRWGGPRVGGSGRAEPGECEGSRGEQRGAEHLLHRTAEVAAGPALPRRDAPQVPEQGTGGGGSISPLPLAVPPTPGLSPSTHGLRARGCQGLKEWVGGDGGCRTLPCQG